jgi:hypothetical protein
MLGRLWARRLRKESKGNKKESGNGRMGDSATSPFPRFSVSPHQTLLT